MGAAGILLTGATGFLGGELLPRLLRAHPDATVHCLIRAASDLELGTRLERVLVWNGVPEEDRARVRAVRGTLKHDDLGLGSGVDALARACDEVYHCAARTRFDLPLEQLCEVNRDGTARVLAFARRAAERGGLRRFHHLSTAYVVGARVGVFREEDARPGDEFHNGYEQSKWMSEQLLWEAPVPVTVYRPSIVVGDSRTGRTLHFRVLYDPMKWVYFGKTNVLPCRPDHRLDVVPVDYVCDALIALGQRPDTAGQTFHLTAGPERAARVEELVRIAVAEGNAYHAEIGRPAIEMPRIVSPDDLEAASAEEREALHRVVTLSQGVMRSHLPYMLEEQLFDPSRSEALLAGAAAPCPPLTRYFGTICRWAVERGYEAPAAGGAA